MSELELNQNTQMHRSIEQSSSKIITTEDTRMKAVVYEKYGSPSEVLELKKVEKPTPKDNEVLVKVYASSISYADNAFVRGKPFIARLSSGLQKPKNKILGFDISGQVEAVGRNVKQFQPGDEIFGDIGACGFGAFAEYVSIPENALAKKPVNLTYEEAASVPQCACASDTLVTVENKMS
jgi:NADPH:quinone reductase-like Zn-dependent oxidoreductase